MTPNEAQQRATKLGLSTWMAQAAVVGSESATITLKCVGFASIPFTLGEAETWEDALGRATQIIFSA
ncbi:MAG TPA: hypothetical protein VGK93_11570 [Candidatus Eisenbacteria bacterium]|jgi:hypothetical protein